MRFILKKYVIGIFLMLFYYSEAQEEYFVCHTRFLQKINASYFGYDNLNRVGVLYNSLRLNTNQGMDNKYVFGSFSFDKLNFSLGLEVNSFKTEGSGLTITLAKVTYVYKLQLDNALYLLPAVTLGFGRSSIKGELIFEDQLDHLTGVIRAETIDPLGENEFNINYMDLGASFIIHNDQFIAGLSLKQLNRPNVSYNEETKYRKPIRISANFGYEFDINPYDKRILPRYSYLLTYGSITKSKDLYFAYLSQELQLGEFSLGLNEQISLTNVNAFSLNNIGLFIGLAVKNLDFGIAYNFQIQNKKNVFSPSIFEVYITLNFNKFGRNQRGSFKRLQTDNYY